MYHDIALSAFRYLGCRSFEEVDRMTMSEFELRMIAFNLAEVDEERKRHELAYLNVKAQATNKKGKPVFESFKSFMIMKNELLKFWQLTSHNERN